MAESWVLKVAVEAIEKEAFTRAMQAIHNFEGMTFMGLNKDQLTKVIRYYEETSGRPAYMIGAEKEPEKANG